MLINEIQFNSKMFFVVFLIFCLKKYVFLYVTFIKTFTYLFLKKKFQSVPENTLYTHLSGYYAKEIHKTYSHVLLDGKKYRSSCIVLAPASLIFRNRVARNSSITGKKNPIKKKLIPLKKNLN